jgi:hypothetical protein
MLDQHLKIQTQLSQVAELLALACPKNEEGRTGADAQTDANETDKHKHDRQIRRTQTEVGQDDNRQAKTQTKRPPNSKDHNSQSSKTNRQNN